MLIAYIRLHRRSLVAFPAREMVFARGELSECGRTGIAFLLIEGSVCGPDRGPRDILELLRGHSS